MTASSFHKSMPPDGGRRLEGRLVIVTGAAGGIGGAIARAAAMEGARLILSDLREEQAAALAGELGREARAIAHDVTREGDWAKLADLCHAEGGLHGLVNNAGIYDPRTIAETDAAFFDLTQRVNQLGTFLGIRLMERAAASAGSSVVNVSSLAGLRGTRGIAYAASKWAVRGMTKTAALELAPRGIRVNSIHPAFIDTPILATAPREHLESRTKSIPLGRWGTPEEVARLVIFLLADESNYITGAEIAIDGGLSV